jgi:uncharacterized peroxidase-related enzyme
VQAHAHDLRDEVAKEGWGKGEGDAYVHAVARGWRSAPLTDADRALCEFAVKLTHDQERMSPGDLEHLRDHGFDDRAIHDATQVIAYFNYITRVSDALGVEPEDFIRPWGKE